MGIEQSKQMQESGGQCRLLYHVDLASDDVDIPAGQAVSARCIEQATVTGIEIDRMQ